MRVLLMVVVVASSACATAGGTPRPFPRPGGHGAEPPTASRPNGGAGPIGTALLRTDGYQVSGTALSFRGTPYRNGGADPSGFDCSGFVRYVFAQHGMALPRTVEEQFHAGRPVVERRGARGAPGIDVLGGAVYWSPKVAVKAECR